MSKEELQSKVQPQVELDTDDVKEEKVELEQEQPKEKEGVASLNVGEVDLGYTDHSPKKEEEKTTSACKFRFQQVTKKLLIEQSHLFHSYSERECLPAFKTARNPRLI